MSSRRSSGQHPPQGGGGEGRANVGVQVRQGRVQARDRLFMRYMLWSSTNLYRLLCHVENLRRSGCQEKLRWKCHLDTRGLAASSRRSLLSRVSAQTNPKPRTRGQGVWGHQPSTPVLSF